MAIGRSTAVRRQLQLVFRAGAAGSLGDGPLLERFLNRQEGADEAFETLMARHGPMVHSVCRQVLGATHDADDAFQATFLILIRQAREVRRRDAIGGWLYGVARRVALRARSDAARRRHQERQAGVEEAAPENTDAEDRHSLLALLYEEIARLPEKYRAPVVLCELGGRTHAEAANQLNWPVGTVSGRLSRARDLLRGRIARRGLTLPAGLLAAAAWPRSAPAALVEATDRTAVRFVSDGGTPSPAAALAVRVLAARRVTRVKIAAALVLTAGVAAGGTRFVRLEAEQSSARSSPRPVLAAPDTRPAVQPRRGVPIVSAWPDEEATSVAFAPDGKTVASGRRDATVTLWDVETLHPRATLRGHSAPILALTFSPDGDSLASTDADQILKVWDVATGREQVSMTWLPAAPPASNTAAAPAPAPDDPVQSRSGC